MDVLKKVNAGQEKVIRASSYAKILIVKLLKFEKPAKI